MKEKLCILLSYEALPGQEVYFEPEHMVVEFLDQNRSGVLEWTYTHTHPQSGP